MHRIFNICTVDRNLHRTTKLFHFPLKKPLLAFLCMIDAMFALVYKKTDISSVAKFSFLFAKPEFFTEIVEKESHLSTCWLHGIRSMCSVASVGQSEAPTQTIGSIVLGSSKGLNRFWINYGKNRPTSWLPINFGRAHQGSPLTNRILSSQNMDWDGSAAHKTDQSFVKELTCRKCKKDFWLSVQFWLKKDLKEVHIALMFLIKLFGSITIQLNDARFHKVETAVQNGLSDCLCVCVCVWFVLDKQLVKLIPQSGDWINFFLHEPKMDCQAGRVWRWPMSVQVWAVEERAIVWKDEPFRH